MRTAFYRVQLKGDISPGKESGRKSTPFPNYVTETDKCFASSKYKQLQPVFQSHDQLISIPVSTRGLCCNMK